MITSFTVTPLRIERYRNNQLVTNFGIELAFHDDAVWGGQVLIELGFWELVNTLHPRIGKIPVTFELAPSPIWDELNDRYDVTPHEMIESALKEATEIAINLNGAAFDPWKGE